MGVSSNGLYPTGAKPHLEVAGGALWVGVIFPTSYGSSYIGGGEDGWGCFCGWGVCSLRFERISWMVVTTNHTHTTLLSYCSYCWVGWGYSFGSGLALVVALM